MLTTTQSKIAGAFYKSKLEHFRSGNEDYAEGEVSEWRSLVTSIANALVFEDEVSDRREFIDACRGLFWDTPR